VLKELANIIAGSLLVIFEKSWRLGEVSADGEQKNEFLSSSRSRRSIQGVTG